MLGNTIIRLIKYILILALYLLLASLTLNIAKAEAPIADEEEISIEDYAKFKVTTTWSEDQWEYFDELIFIESSWNPLAQNPNSTAFGLGQFLNSTWGLVGCKKTNDPRTQIDCTIKYIEKVYHNPQKALKFHNSHNWY